MSSEEPSPSLTPSDTDSETPTTSSPTTSEEPSTPSSSDTPPTSSPTSSSEPTPSSTPPTSEPPTSSPTSSSSTSEPPPPSSSTSTPPAPSSSTEDPPPSSTPSSDTPLPPDTTTITSTLPPSTPTTEEVVTEVITSTSTPTEATLPSTTSDSSDTAPSSPSSSPSPSPSSPVVQSGKTLTATSTAPGPGLQTGVTASGGTAPVNIGALVGGLVGGAAVVAAIIGLLLFCRHRRKRRQYDGLAIKEPPRPSWTPMGIMATLPKVSEPEPYRDAYYDPYATPQHSSHPHSAEGTQYLAAGGAGAAAGVRHSNPNSQHSSYTQISQVDDWTPGSSTGQLLVGSEAAAGPGAARSEDDVWHEAQMYQDHYFGGTQRESDPADRTTSNGTPRPDLGWGAAASAPRKLGMTNPDPVTPDTPTGTLPSLPGTAVAGASPTKQNSGNDTPKSANRGVPSGGSPLVPTVSPPRPPKSERRFSQGADKLIDLGREQDATAARLSVASQYSDPIDFSAPRPGGPDETFETDPFEWDANRMSSAGHSLPPGASSPSTSRDSFGRESFGVARGGSRSAQPDLTLPPGAAQSSAGPRQETLPRYDPQWEEEQRGSSNAGFLDIKRKLLGRAE